MRGCIAGPAASIAVLKDMEVAKQMRLSKNISIAQLRCPCALFQVMAKQRKVLEEHACGIALPTTSGPICWRRQFFDSPTMPRSRLHWERNGRRLVEEQYSWSAIVESWLAELASRSHPPSPETRCSRLKTPDPIQSFSGLKASTAHNRDAGHLDGKMEQSESRVMQRLSMNACACCMPFFWRQRSPRCAISIFWKQGGGSGRVIGDFIDAGALPQNMIGIDLLEDRIAIAAPTVFRKFVFSAAALRHRCPFRIAGPHPFFYGIQFHPRRASAAVDCA